MKTLEKIILGIGAALVLGALLISFQAQKNKTIGAIQSGTTTTNSSSTVTGTAALVLSSFTGAQYRSMVNKSAINVWITCNSTSTGFVAGTGRFLAPSSTVELVEEAGTMWCTDNIYGITDGGTAVIGTSQR